MMLHGRTEETWRPFFWNWKKHKIVHGYPCLRITERLGQVSAAREEVPGRRGYPGYMCALWMDWDGPAWTFMHHLEPTSDRFKGWILMNFGILKFVDNLWIIFTLLYFFGIITPIFLYLFGIITTGFCRRKVPQVHGPGLSLERDHADRPNVWHMPFLDSIVSYGNYPLVIKHDIGKSTIYRWCFPFKPWYL